MLSPPGRLSMMTGWPHFFCSRSLTMRARMSAPAPGPNGMMNRTGRCGQLCAWAGSGAAMTSAARSPAAMAAIRIFIWSIAISRVRRLRIAEKAQALDRASDGFSAAARRRTRFLARIGERVAQHRGQVRRAPHHETRRLVLPDLVETRLRSEDADRPCHAAAVVEKRSRDRNGAREHLRPADGKPVGADAIEVRQQLLAIAIARQRAQHLLDILFRHAAQDRLSAGAARNMLGLADAARNLQEVRRRDLQHAEPLVSAQDEQGRRLIGALADPLHDGLAGPDRIDAGHPVVGQAADAVVERKALWIA